MLILLGLFSSFFSWVSAEPLWLSLGHSRTGTAIVAHCSGEGWTHRCKGDLETVRVNLLGIGHTTTPGDRVDVRLVNERSQHAYASSELLLHWLPGLVLVLLCGLGIALVTAFWRLPDKRQRWSAFGVSLGAPFLVMIGFLAATF